MYRIQYLLALMLLIFAALYVLFGTIGWEHARTFNDKAMPLLLASIHCIAATFLLYHSYRTRRAELRNVSNSIRTLLAVQPSLTPKQVAEHTKLSLGEITEYLTTSAKENKLVLIRTGTTEIVRVYPKHTLN